MHRKQFSCFSIESLIGHGIDGQQPRQTQVADGGDSSAVQRSHHCRFAAQSSPVDRVWTAYNSRIDDRPLSADGDTRQQRTGTRPSLNDWSRCLSTVIATSSNCLSTRDPPTSQFQPHLRCGI